MPIDSETAALVCRGRGIPARAPASSEGLPMALKERLGDRRTALRFEIIGQLWGALDTFDRLPLRNLTRGGALVETPMPPDPDQIRSVRFGREGASHDIEVRVRHVTPSRTATGQHYLVGLQFLEPSALALEEIDRLVEARLAEMRSVPEA